MASRFETFSEDEICAINGAVVQKIPRKGRTFASRCSLIGRKLFSG